MKSRELLKKLHRDKREFVTAGYLEKLCDNFRLSYKSTLSHFLAMGYITRIFRGIFYVRSPEEIELGSFRYSAYELVAKGMELKGIERWYFGLHTALKFNHMTHEHFAVDTVVNERISRPRPVGIAGHKFRFIKMKGVLLDFGVAEEGSLRYSDPEKTLLDFIYLRRYRGVPEEKILLDLEEWVGNVSMEKAKRYAGKYPKSVLLTLEKVVA